MYGANNKNVVERMNTILNSKEIKSLNRLNVHKFHVATTPPYHIVECKLQEPKLIE